MKIGILGGAFNPPTKAHTYLVNRILDEELVDAIWVMPTYEHIEGKETLPFKARVRMCEIAIQKLERPKSQVQVSKFEKLFPNLKSTWSIFEKLKDVYPHHEFYMIIGMDRALDISTWYNWQELIENIPFIIIDRNQEDFVRESLTTDWFRKSPHQYLNESHLPDISSTAVRAFLNDKEIYDGNSLLQEMVDAEIFEYANKFYTKQIK